jgi:uncharacterized heparinase superfamily protein
MEYLPLLEDRDFERIITDWLDGNPPFGPKYWLSGWGSYPLSSRAVMWMQQFSERRHRLAPAFKERLLTSLANQIGFLRRNLELDIRGNHLIKDLRALLWASAFFDGAAAREWGACAEPLLENELKEQVLRDGMHFERSPAYHCQVFGDLLDCFVVLDKGPLKDLLQDKLSAMAQVTVDMTHPDGLTSLFSDGGLHMTHAPGTLLNAWATVTNDSVRPRRTFYLKEAGYCGLRLENSLILLDCGQIAPDTLPAHGHGDIFSFEWSVNGHRLIVDSGVFEYRAGPCRDYVRGTRAHNTVVVNGVDQCEFFGSFRVGRRARVHDVSWEELPDGFVLSGRHDGYARLDGQPIHERVVKACDSLIEVRDVVTGGTGQAVEARLLLHPEADIKTCEHGACLEMNGVPFDVRTSSVVRIVDAPWYPDFGVVLASRQIVIDYGPAPVAGGFVIERQDRAGS